MYINIYKHVTTINEKEVMILKVSKKECISGFKRRNWGRERRNYVIISKMRKTILKTTL